MRKISLLVLALLLLILGSLQTAAKTPEELSDLARYFPVISPAYAAIRTDSAFIDELDGVVSNVDESLGGLLAGMNLRDVLDMLAKQIDPEGSYETTFAWLGETAAIAVVVEDPSGYEEGEEDAPFVIALAVNDASAAELFVDNLTAQGYEKEDTPEGILYAPEQGSADMPTVFLGEDVLLFRQGSLEAETIIPAFDASLADNPDFVAAMGRLPLEDYNAIAYVDPMIARSALEEAQEELSEQPMPMAFDILALAEAVGPQSAGFVILDGRNFVMDISSHIADVDAYLAAGGTLSASEPINLSFANNLPATVPLFIQDNGLGANIIEGLAQMEAFGDFYDEQYEAGTLDYEQYDLRQLDEAAVFMRQSLEGLSGLTLDAAFGWMSGDYILSLNLLEGINEDVPVLPDFSVIVEVTDGAAAESFNAALLDIFYQLGLDTEDENGVTVMSVLGDMAETENLDLLFGVSGDVFAFGTRATTAAVLNAEGGMADAEHFQYASQYFLPETQFLAYAYFPTLEEVLRPLAEGDRDMGQLVTLLSVLESGSITATYNGEGDGAVRLILTLRSQ